MDEIIEYIKSFLLYGNSDASKLIGYTADETQWEKYAIVILPNGHLGKDLIYPDLETPKISGKVISTDIIYNTFFFISRAEELLNPQRDQHNRFLASYSILGEGNRLQMPIVDEYARILMEALGLAFDNQPHFSAIYLTHDLDEIERFRHIRGAVGGILRGQWEKVLASWKDIKNDPVYTFDWLLSKDADVQNRYPTLTKQLYFAKDTQGTGYDYPQYNLQGQDFLRLANVLKQHNAKIGRHRSYYGTTYQHSNFPDFIEKNLCRCHFLRCSIEYMQQLVQEGITDDFTMGFADKAGFRLQTTRPVRWINPKTMELTNLVLHPLTVMDCTLSNSNYMNLNEDEAYAYCQTLVQNVKKYHGELVLLWHNSIFSQSYHRSLYPRLLASL